MLGGLRENETVNLLLIHTTIHAFLSYLLKITTKCV